MLRSLLYVSRRSPSIARSEAAVAEILAAARLYNDPRSITGALACTERYFTQLLEGPETEVEPLIRRIEGDTRHSDVSIVRVETILQARLPGWSMAYSGPSTYVARQVGSLIERSTPMNSARADGLLDLLVGLADQAPDAS